MYNNKEVQSWCIGLNRLNYVYGVCFKNQQKNLQKQINNLKTIGGSLSSNFEETFNQISLEATSATATATFNIIPKELFTFNLFKNA